MSLYYCSITGELAETPVISKKTGHVFEKRVIEKYLDVNQTCPITNQPLTKADIIPLQITKTTKPRPVNASGVPEMMTLFQGEWDSLMLEVHGLKQNLESVRQELSHALYQHDAACRVIARLTKERDIVRSQLAEVGQDGVRAGGMEEELPSDLPQEVVERITQRKAELSGIRKERRKDKEYIGSFATEQAIAGYKVATSKALHSTTKPGITALDIDAEQDNLLVTGGNDGSVLFYDRTKNKVVNTFEKNQRKITDVKFIPKNPTANGAQCLVSSEDGTGYLLSNKFDSGEIVAPYKVDIHRDALVGCAVHPLSSIGVFSCRDGSFSYHDLTQGRLLSYVSLDGYHLKTLKIHPDGHLAVLAGHDGTLRVWNVLEHKQIAEIRAHNGPIDSLSFSENGVNFATGSIFDKTVKLWDLRNLGEENFKLVDEHSGGVVNFDHFGQVLAIGTTAVRLYNVKSLEEVGRFDEHKDVITSIQFGNRSKYIASVALDGYLNIYS